MAAEESSGLLGVDAVLADMEFDVIQGDIAAQSADVLVNAAGTSLQMGSGVAGFDLREGTRIICAAIDGYGPETLDDIRVIAYSDAEYETVREVAAEVRST